MKNADLIKNAIGELDSPDIIVCLRAAKRLKLLIKEELNELGILGAKGGSSNLTSLWEKNQLKSSLQLLSTTDPIDLYTNLGAVRKRMEALFMIIQNTDALKKLIAEIKQEHSL